MADLAPPDLPWSVKPGTRSSAVLMLFIRPAEPGAPARILLMRRSTKVRTHKGQIGFAGGRAEPQDATPGATALRELEEEVGIPQGRVRLIGQLPLAQALDHPVVPVVGIADVDLPDLTPSPDEVEFLFAEPWPSFAAAAARQFRFNIFGNWRTSQLFDAGGRTVWGLTAYILHEAALA